MTSGVLLTKEAPVRLLKETVAPGQFYLNVRWPGSCNLDLDTIAMWKAADGRQGLVYALGNFGSRQQLPFMWIPEDKRTGGGDGEWIYGDTAPMLSTLSWIGLGLYNYGSTHALGTIENAVATIKVPGQPKMMFPLGKIGSDVCSLAQIHFSADAMHVHNDVQAIGRDATGLKLPPLATHWGYVTHWRRASK